MASQALPPPLSPYKPPALRRPWMEHRRALATPYRPAYTPCTVIAPTPHRYQPTPASKGDPSVDETTTRRKQIFHFQVQRCLSPLCLCHPPIQFVPLKISPSRPSGSWPPCHICLPVGLWHLWFAPPFFWSKNPTKIKFSVTFPAELSAVIVSQLLFCIKVLKKIFFLLFFFQGTPPGRGWKEPHFCR